MNSFSTFVHAKNIKIAIFVAVALTCMFIVPRYLVPDLTFTTEGSEVVDEAYPLFEKSGLCLNKRLCVSSVYGIKPIKGGFILQVVGATDMRIIKEIEEIIERKFEAVPAIQLIKYEVCTTTATLPLSEDVALPCDKVIYKETFKR